MSLGTKQEPVHSAFSDWRKEDQAFNSVTFDNQPKLLPRASLGL